MASDIGVAFLLMIILGIGLVLSLSWRNSVPKHEVVQHGCAEWVADEFGKTEFKWKD